MAKFASPDLANDIASYIDKFQSTFRKIAIEAYKKSENADPAIYALLKNQESKDNLAPSKKSLTLDNLTEEQKVKYFDVYGKIYDLSTIAIKVSNSLVVKEYESEFERLTGKKTGSSADNLEYTLTKMMENEHFSIQEKVALMQKAYISTMITGHPTDPTSVQHKVLLSEVEKFVFDNIEKKQIKREDINELKTVLKDYFSSPITSGKKTQKLEAEEGNIFFENMYYGNKQFNKRFQGLADKFGFRDEFEKQQSVTNKEFLALTKWLGGGDGDGNDNSTRDSLEEGIKSGRATISKIYINELNNIQKLLGKTLAAPEHIKNIEQLKKGITEHQFTKKSELVANINTIISEVSLDKDLKQHKAAFKKITSELDLLKNGMNTFGLYCGTTDLRHDSESIHWTVAKTSDKAKQNALERGDTESAKKFLTFDEYMNLPHLSTGKDTLSKSKYMKSILKNADLVEQVSQVDFNSLQRKVDGQWDASDKEGFQARRILGREKLVAEYEGSSRNFIISEAKSSSDYLAVDFLKKASKFKGEQNPVLLVESLEDIKKLPTMIRNLLKDPYSAKQIQGNKLVVMIADSDNRRRAGFDVDYFIDYAKQALFKIAEKSNINLEIVDGGGPDGSRGGQYESTKKPLHHGYNASRAGVKEIGVTGQTLQGRQNNNHFLSPQSAASFMEALYSQQLYAFAALKEIIPNPRLNNDEKSDQYGAWASQRAYCRTGVKDFREAQVDKPFKNLYDAGPWLSNKLSNNSSRPDKRGGDLGKAANGDMTIGQYLGEPYYILDARAISGATFFRHSGILPELMIHDAHAEEYLLHSQQHKGKPTNFVYNNSKQTREHFRELAKSLYRCDYDNAWVSFTGSVPSAEQKAQYLSEFDPKSKNNSVEASLAVHEQKALQIAKNVYQIILGREPNMETFDLKRTFGSIWPAQAKQLDILNENSKAAKDFVARENYFFNSNRDKPLTPDIIERIKAVSQAVSALADENTIPQAGIIAAANLSAVDRVGIDKQPNLVVQKLNLALPKFLEAASKSFGLNFNQK